jgi:hypothetical protein
VAYERTLRVSFAPFPPRGQNGFFGHRCDETVGDFCLRGEPWFDDLLLPETPLAELSAIRDGVISELADIVADLPHDTLISVPLVRLLVEEGRTVEAVDAALAFAAADTADAWSWLLLGFALGPDRQTEAAERAFERATERLGPEERERMWDVSYLLADSERPAYRGLSAAEQWTYRERLWRAADPLYLTSGNVARAPPGSGW